MAFILMLLPVLVLGAVYMLCRRANSPPPKGPAVRQVRREELLQKRTELYELLFYAQKKYRETGERRFLQDAKQVHAQILDCDRALRILSAEQ